MYYNKGIENIENLIQGQPTFLKLSEQQHQQLLRVKERGTGLWITSI